MITTHSEDYIHHATLRHVYALPLGWIRQLGQPDKVEAHPRDPTKKVTLYARRRVEAFIGARRAAYMRMLLARATRLRPATTGTCRQAQQLMAWARSVDITVGPLPETLTRLKQETKTSFLSRQAGGSCQNFVLTDKAIVAHIRHTYSNYHQLLARLQRAPGTTVAYLILKRRVNRAVRDRLRQQYGDFSRSAEPSSRAQAEGCSRRSPEEPR